MIMPDWPWPTDSREDRARRVALSYRQLVEMAIAGRIPCLPDALAKLDERWCSLSQGWVKPTHAPLDPESWLTPKEIADLLHIDTHDLRNWHARGHVRRRETQGFPPRYSVEDVIKYGARIRRSTTKGQQ